MKIKKIETNYKRKMFLYETSHIDFSPDIFKEENLLINIYPFIEFQEFMGFGGALTESVCYNLYTCNKNIRDYILDEYFSTNKMNYTICRLSIGSSDFSLNSYSYSNKEDLSDFSISEDMKYVVPIIKMAQNRNTRLQFLASPWSPPAFMKSNRQLTNGGNLLSNFKKAYSKYLVRYIKEYKKENININYMTIQNEPNAKQIWESCLYNANEEIDLLTNFIYPQFRLNGINTKLLIWDHNKEKLLNRSIDSFNNEKAINQVSGIAFHWYTGDHFENVELVKKMFPDKLLIHTEGCTGYSNFRKNDEVKNAEIYAHDIIGDLNAGINYFIDWNMVLNYEGGPNHKDNFCNSPIMLSKDKNSYIKNLSFYYIAHFSKFIKPGSKRIAYSKFSDKFELTAFKNLDNSVIIVLLNRNSFNVEYNLKINNHILHDNLDSHAIVTFVIKHI